jgi:hypothetical protein
MNKISKTIVAAFAILVFVYGNGLAVPTLGYVEQWATDASDWVEDPLSDNAIAVTHDDSGEFLKMVVTGADAIPGYGRAITSVNTWFTGDFTASGALAIQFELLTFGNTPGELQLYFGNTGSAHIWAIDLIAMSGAPVANGVTTYSATFDSAGWIGQNGAWTMGDLASDWGQVAWLGLYIQGSSDLAETYGMDNMTLTVPEPETVWMILMVLASLGFTFRSRLASVAGMIKARIRA